MNGNSIEELKLDECVKKLMEQSDQNVSIFATQVIIWVDEGSLTFLVTEFMENIAYYL